MNEFEYYTIRCCMSEVAALRNVRNKAIAEQIAERIRVAAADKGNPLLPEEDLAIKEDAAKFVNRQSASSDTIGKIAPVALDIVFEQHERLLNRLKAQSIALANFVAEILQKHHPRGQEIAAGQPRNTIFENWQSGTISPNDLASGIYQIYRRHKPVDPVPDEMEHHLVTELVRIDTTEKKCVLIGSDGEVNYGTIHVNSRKAAFFLYQRRLGDNNFEYRFYCLELAGRRKLYPSLCIRIGDVTGRPIMSECFAIFVSRRRNTKLYDAFDALGLDEKAGAKIEDDSIIFDYIAPSPPPGGGPSRRPIKYVKDFPFFSKIVSEPPVIPGALRLFQEPVKAMNNADIFRMLERLGIAVPDIFRHGPP